MIKKLAAAFLFFSAFSFNSYASSPIPSEVKKALPRVNKLCSEIAESIKTRLVTIDSTISECFGADVTGPPVVLIVTSTTKARILPEEFAQTIVPKIETQLKRMQGRLIFVVFNEMFFFKGVLDETSVNQYLAQLRDISVRYKNVILIPHFLYRTNESFVFNNPEAAGRFFAEYDNHMNFFQDGGRARFRVVGEGQSTKLNYPHVQDGWQTVETMHPSTPGRCGDDIRAAIMTKAGTIVKEQTPFNFLRSITYMIYGGELLCSYKKAGYCFESDNMLSDKRDKGVLYDFGTGQTDLCLCPSCKPHFAGLAQILKDKCKINICFDLRLRATPQEIFKPYEAQDMLHIIQSNTIFPATATFATTFPRNTLVVHSDAQYQYSEPKFHAFVFGENPQRVCAYRWSRTDSFKVGANSVTISACDFF